MAPDDQERYCGQCRQYEQEIERLRAEVARLRKHNDTGCASAHVLIECGVRPGIDSPCRCDECRLVAREMDDAGFLDHVKDRWWEEAARRREGEMSEYSVPKWTYDAELNSLHAENERLRSELETERGHRQADNAESRQEIERLKRLNAVYVEDHAKAQDAMRREIYKLREDNRSLRFQLRDVEIAEGGGDGRDD